MENKPDMPGADINPVNWLDQHGDVLFAYALTRVRNRATAEDLVQDTLLAAIKSINEFKGESTERTWLTGILKHKIIDHLRVSTREQPLDMNIEIMLQEQSSHFDESGHWNAALDSWDQPEKNLEQEEFWMTMASCIDKLPENLRIIYTLREIDGIETDELIKTLNISSKSNVWVMLSRARFRLRDCIQINWFNN